ncbi:MAG: hypothetical protein K1Y36_12540 [Blastocatellia bacterium]|nr:hypothetical protein [Blastocatellia bacterium]
MKRSHPNLEKPIVYACSGCSSIAQLANQVALDLDRAGRAEMSCIAGVGGGVKPLVKKAKSGRRIIALDGCPLQCARHCLQERGITPTLHYTLTQMGIEKHYHQDFDQQDRQMVETQVLHDLEQLEQGVVPVSRWLAQSVPQSDDPPRFSLMLFLRSLFFTLLFPGTVTVGIPVWLLVSGRSWNFPAAAWTWLPGAILLVAGMLGLLRCIWEFYAVGKGTLAPVDPPKVLVVQGLYRFVRNPMYVAVLTVLLGETMFFHSAALLLEAALFWLVTHLFVIFYEEPALSRMFGESYASYRQQVNRWLPRFPRQS